MLDLGMEMERGRCDPISLRPTLIALFTSNIGSVSMSFQVLNYMLAIKAVYCGLLGLFLFYFFIRFSSFFLNSKKTWRIVAK